MITPQFVGQRYKDTNTGNIWIANSTTPGDWTLEVQNMQIEWTPSSVKVGEGLGYFLNGDYGDKLTGVTSLTFVQAILGSYFELQRASNLVSLSFPNLTEAAGANGFYDAIKIANFTALTSIAMPLLEKVYGTFEVSATKLASLSLPSLTLVDSTMTVSANSLLTTVSLPQWLPTNTCDVLFNINALTASSVNHILARAVASAGYVSGTIVLNGGTNAAPNGQGVVDKATLIGRGVTVTTN